MLFSLSCSLLLLVSCYIVSNTSVFLSMKDASEILRKRRPRSIFEELKPGNMERECVEEECNFEEAREIFKDESATLKFWNKYIDGDQCEPQPCANDGTCLDLIGGFQCFCPEERDGSRCQYELVVTNCSTEYGYCEHFCHEISDINRRKCSCAKGYNLSDNGFACNPTGNYSCGRHKLASINDVVRLTGGKVIKKGSSPWQVMLMNARGFFKCGGVLIHRFWVVTAAHCVHEGGRFRVRLGEYNRTIAEGTEDTIRVKTVHIHPNFTLKTLDSDIALLNLEEAAIFSNYIIPVCLPTKEMAERVLLIPGKMVLVTGWGAVDENDHTIRPSTLLFININLVSYENCVEVLPGKITENMICAGAPGTRRDACSGDSGGPMVTVHSGTWFLIGLVSWGEGCGHHKSFGVYTNVVRYLEWIDSFLT
ncbi:vitamin K-dependent protein C precursor [Callorhinchus milii]|uniref:Vitamin K-dependent protein C n=1 Tax=Callorhinchus milii TaxID=7868 RepID=K4GHX9_CALMI|nr:vitamin K-dependent protein C precursor [Callorhinchus milii]AFM90443.1 vitamin K-dependent protein C-like protein [Callorhinchus milii]